MQSPARQWCLPTKSSTPSLARCWLTAACNLASPIITGFLFEMLAGRGRPVSQYPAFFAAFAAIYITEPLLTRVYIRRVCYAAENVRRSALEIVSYVVHGVLA